MNMLLLQLLLQEVNQGFFDMLLDEPEFLVTLVSQNFAKERHIVVVTRISPNSINDSSRPLDDQRFEAIALVQEGVHVLLHGLARQLVLFASLVVLHLVIIDFVYQLLQLLDSQTAHLGRPDLA